MESIYVLVNADGVENPALIDVLGERQLHEDAMNLGIVVVSLHNLFIEEMSARTNCLRMGP